jgi:hypothetical protein
VTAVEGSVPRKPEPLPLPRLAGPERFDTILTTLLAVKKKELQQVDVRPS